MEQAASRVGARPARIYEGALLFATDISGNYRDSMGILHTNESGGRQNDGIPPSKLAAQALLADGEVEVALQGLRGGLHRRGGGVLTLILY
jgi:hypothetical protein